MTFLAAVPLGGIAGWRFLGRTLQAQETLLSGTPVHARALEDFRARMPGVKTAEALVSDRRLLGVALGAFGLDADINNRFMLRRMISEGVDSPGTLANRLADSRYRQMVATLRLDQGSGQGPGPDGIEAMAAAYVARQFEAAVGVQDEGLRLALNARRELPRIAEEQTTERGRWFLVLANPPLRRVVETALGLPRAFGALDLDRQVDEIRRSMQRNFGSGEISGLAEPARLERLVERFLLRDGLTSGPSSGTRGFAALALLSAGGAQGLSRWR